MAAQVEIPDDQIKMPAAKMAVAVNAYLPRDIRVMAAARCRAGFRRAVRRQGQTVSVLLWNGPAMNPLLRQQAWHVCRPLDLSRHARRRQVVSWENTTSNHWPRPATMK